MGIFEQSLALQETGWLGTMAIGYYCDLSRQPYRWLGEGRIKKYLRKRFHPGLNSSQVSIHPLPFAVSEVGVKLAKNGKDRDRWVFWVNAEFDRWVASRLHRFGNLAFGYESGSLFTFRRAKELGFPCVMYQPIACAERAMTLLKEEAEYFP